MARRSSNAPGRAAIYNRLWHFDADDRRHRGHRRWDVAALEGFFALAAKLDWLYPPDFSDRDQIALRTTGNRLFAQVFTDRPTVLRLVLHVPARREFVVRSAKDLEDGELARGLAEAISAIGAGGG